MRTILFFDLPRETSKETRAAARFVKDIKKEGFIMLQESVYCKLMLNMSAFDALRKRLDKIKPTKGNIILLTITEKQFNSMELLLGEISHKEYDSADRVVVL